MSCVTNLCLKLSMLMTDINPEHNKDMIDVDTVIENSQWHNHICDIPEKVSMICKTAFDYSCAKILMDILDRISSVEIAVLLSDNREMQDLNNRFRHQDKATNILSFPSYFASPSPDDINENGIFHLGDIILGLEKIKEEAEAQKKSFENHFTHLLIHGVLHLCGYEHDTDKNATEMEQLEIRILNDFGIENPYLQKESMA